MLSVGVVASVLAIVPTLAVARILGDPPHLMEKLDRLQLGMPALHGLDQHGGQFVGMLL